MKQKKMIKKALLLCFTLLLVVCALASCGSKTKINSTWTAQDIDADTYFSRVLVQSPEARERFIAAYRGYDMSAEGFDDSTVVIGEVKEINVEAARKAVDLVKPEDDASILKFNEFREDLANEGVIEKTVARMGETVDLEKSNNPLVWIGKFLQVITNITGGYYVLALFVFAIIIELLLLYFGIRQQQNSIKQAKLSPKERAIRKKYAGRNDPKSMQAMQQEIQKMYQEAGFNPMGGCLPLLIQMPIIIALYNIVIDPIRYVLGKSEALSLALSQFATTSRAAGGLGMEIASGRGSIELLSKLNAENLSHFGNFSYYSNASSCAAELSDVVGNLPNFNLFGINMGLTPGFKPPYLLLLVPVLTFVAYFASMKLNRKFMYQPAVQDPQMGCSNNIMDITMPLMSVYITFITPAAVGIYWIFKCITGVLKQLILSKVMPLPVITEEDYKRAEKEMRGKGRQAPARAPSPNRGPVRSLHHIDDEDDLPPRVRESGEEEEYIPAERRQRQQQEQQQGAQPRVNGAPLKEDRKNNRNKK